jgi:hypothetical protein
MGDHHLGCCALGFVMTTARQRKAIYTRAAEGVLCEGWEGVFLAARKAGFRMGGTPELDEITAGQDHLLYLPTEDRAMLLLLAAAMC